MRGYTRTDHADWPTIKLIDNIRASVRVDYGGRDPMHAAIRASAGLSPAEAYLAGCDATRKGIARRISRSITELRRRFHNGVCNEVVP